MKKAFVALLLVIAILATVAAPASAITCVKNYKNYITGRYVTVEKTDNTYVEVWNRYKPYFSHYSDRKLLTLGKNGIYNADQMANCIKGCTFSYAGCSLTVLAPALSAPCMAIATNYCRSTCTKSAINIGINYLK